MKLSFKHILFTFIAVFLPFNIVMACAIYDDVTQTLTLQSVGVTIPTISDTAGTAPFEYYDVELTAYDPDGDGVFNECSFDPGFICFELNPDNPNALVALVPADVPTCTYDATNSTLDAANSTTLDIAPTGTFISYYSRTQTLEVPAVIADGAVAYSDITFTLTKCLREIVFFGDLFVDQAIPCFRLDGLTEAVDTAPDAFGFITQTGVLVSTLVTSDTITPAGYNAAAAISVVGGEYSFDGGTTWTIEVGIINPGDAVTVRHTSAATTSTDTVTTLTIDTVDGTFTSTTEGTDTTPDAFAFTSQTAVALSTVITSETITPTGYNTAAAISVVGGEYSIDGGVTWVLESDPVGTIIPGDSVIVRHTSSATTGTDTVTTLTIDTVSGTFTSTTL